MPSQDIIDILIRSKFDDKGARAAVKAIQQLSPAQVQAARAVAQVAAAQAREAQAAAKAAEAQSRAAVAAQKLAQAQSRSAKEAANAAAAQARSEAAALRLAAAHEKASQSVKRTGDGLAILPRSFAGLTTELQSQLVSLTGWGAALGAAGAVAQSFANAFTMAATLDATTRSIEAQIGTTRDWAATQAEAAAFAEQFGFTQQETTAALAASVPILQSSKAGADEVLATLARLAVLNPAEGIEGAAFALRELASGDVLSLVERFNLSKDAAYQMRDAIAAGADVTQVMSDYLDSVNVGMDTLKQRTEGAIGAMNDLKRAQEELALAQAEWAQGPGLDILQTQILATRGLTRLLSGDFDEAGQSAEATLAALGAYLGTLATTGDTAQAAAAAQRALAEGLGQTAGATGRAGAAWGDAADDAKGLDDALGRLGGSGPGVEAGLVQVSAAVGSVAATIRSASNDAEIFLSLMGRASATGRGTAGPAKPPPLRRFGGRAGEAVAGMAGDAGIRATFGLPRGGGGGGGRAGGGGGRSEAQRLAEQQAREAERAAEQADDIRYKQSENARDLDQKRADAAEARAERLAEIERDGAKRLAEIDRDTARRRADIDRDAGERRKAVRARLGQELAAIEARAAAEQEGARRGLASSIAGSAASLAASQAADNLALAGAGNDPELMAREAAQARRAEGLRAAAERASGFSDATVGQAAFEAESRALEATQALDEEYARRKAELAGNPQALAELERYYAEALAAQRAAVEQEIADAVAAAELRAAAREQEKQEAIRAAEEERRAIAREAQRQREEVAAQALEQKAAVATQAAEQREAVEAEFTKQGEAITRWADDAERDLQRVIDKADEAARALLAVGAPAGGAPQPAAPTPPDRHSGGPVTAGAAYRVMPNETFVAPESGYILPFLPPGMAAGGGGGGAVTFGPGSITVNAAPGMDERALADAVAERVSAQIGRDARGRGFGN